MCDLRAGLWYNLKLRTVISRASAPSHYLNTALAYRLSRGCYLLQAKPHSLAVHGGAVARGGNQPVTCPPDHESAASNGANAARSRLQTAFEPRERERWKMRHQDGLLALNEQRNSKFWNRVDRSDLFSCWMWTGTVDPGNGYGRTTSGNRRVYAHRAAYELSGATIPAGAHILHRCNQKLCCNPLHHYTGDQRQNIADAKRAGALVGSKLTAEKAREVADLWLNHGWTYLRLAEKFSVSPQSISNICKGRTWSKATGIERSTPMPTRKTRKKAATAVLAN